MDEAVRGGARLLAGGPRTAPSSSPPSSRTCRRTPPSPATRCSGPFRVEPVDGVDDGLRRIDDSRFGLQAGVFTHDIRGLPRAPRARGRRRLVGDVPTFRAEQMPYGGVKESGIGREGVRSAMEDYTEPRLMVLTGVSL